MNVESFWFTCVFVPVVFHPPVWLFYRMEKNWGKVYVRVGVAGEIIESDAAGLLPVGSDDLKVTQLPFGEREACRVEECSNIP